MKTGICQLRYKRCAFCGKLFSNKRKGRGVFGPSQFSAIYSCEEHRHKLLKPGMEMVCQDDTCYFETANTKARFYFDRDLLDTVSQYTWHEDICGYAATRNSSLDKIVRLHEMVIERGKGLEIDHIDRNKKNNTAANLRAVSHATNMQNSLQLRSIKAEHFRGVRRKHNRWVAYISHNNEKIYIGSFGSLQEARQARIDKEISLYGKPKDVI